LFLISDSIPDNLWVKEFSVYPDMSVYIRGYSYNVSDIVEFYKALRTFSKFKDLKITAILLAGDGKDSTNSGAAADKKDEKNPDGTPVDPSKPEDPSAATPPAATPSADPNAKDGSDPSGLPALPELTDIGALGSKPKVSAGADDIPTEKCYEFIIGKKI
jgi:hypothetical protein